MQIMFTELKNKLTILKLFVADHFYTLLFLFAIISVVVSVVWYEHEYPCAYGHYEKQYITIYTVDQNGLPRPSGGYFGYVFVCDCRTGKDSCR